MEPDDVRCVIRTKNLLAATEVLPAPIQRKNFFEYRTSAENTDFWESLSDDEKKAIEAKVQQERIDIRIQIDLLRMAQYLTSEIVLLSARWEEIDALVEKIDESSAIIHEREEGDRVLSDPKSHKTIAVLRVLGSTRIGSAESSKVTRELIESHKPKFVVLFGIAAGLRPNNIKIGDVIITDQVWDIRHLRIDKEKGKIPLKAGFVPTQLSSKHLPLPFKIQWLKKRLSKDYGKPIRVLDDFVICCGGVRVKSEEYMEAAAALGAKMGAVEMESAGVAEVCVEKHIPFLIVKIVADFGEIDKEKYDHQRDFCFKLAASTVWHGFLSRNLTASS